MQNTFYEGITAFALALNLAYMNLVSCRFEELFNKEIVHLTKTKKSDFQMQKSCANTISQILANRIFNLNGAFKYLDASIDKLLSAACGVIAAMQIFVNVLQEKILNSGKTFQIHFGFMLICIFVPIVLYFVGRFVIKHELTQFKIQDH